MDEFKSIIDEKRFVDNAVNTIQYSWLIDHMNLKFDKAKYREYIINYLMLNYACRNADTDCIMLTESDFVCIDDSEYMKENYLVILANGNIKWIRNRHKTRFDVPMYEISDERFKISVAKLMERSPFVFENGDGERIHARNLGRIILNATYNTLGQDIYFKIMKKHYRNDMEILLKLSESRPCNPRQMV